VDDNLYNGIFHFFVGATTGILRDVKFTPIKMQSRFTAQVSNVINSKDGKPIDSRFNVIQRYDVDLTCFGFQYFFPGQTIFVDTSLLGFGKSTDPESIARKFTLGGYYLITKVSHDIQGNDFSTNIIAKFIGDGTKMKAA
jgi:hypothetical protein